MPEKYLKLHMDLDSDNNLFVLYVNSISFLELPYRYHETSKTDYEISITANVKFDD